MYEEEKRGGHASGGSRASGGCVYINKPREKTPKIILARRNKSGDAGDAQGEKRCRGASSRVVPKRRLTGWVLGSKLP